jgi:hypothetical protein
VQDPPKNLPKFGILCYLATLPQREISIPKKASGRRKPLSLFLIKPFIFSGPFNSLSTYFHFLSFQFASKKKEKGFLFGRRQGDRMSLPKKIAQNVARHSLC